MHKGPEHYNVGDSVAFQLKDGSNMVGIYDHHCRNGKAYIKCQGRAFERTYQSIKKLGESATPVQLDAPGAPAVYMPTNVEMPLAMPAKQSAWDINQRFDFLQQLIRMVLKGTAVSLVITGEGGLGKSYTVKRELERRLLTKNEEYLYVKGFSTPKGLYRTLYENNGKIIVFDDCDSILEHSVAVNLLKAALDSYEEREISWISQSFDDSVPPALYSPAVSYL